MAAHKWVNDSTSALRPGPKVQKPCDNDGVVSAAILYGHWWLRLCSRIASAPWKPSPIEESNLAVINTSINQSITDPAGC